MNGKGLSEMAGWCSKLAEFNVEVEHRAGKESAVADTLSRNYEEIVEVVEGVRVCALSSLVLRSREQLIQEQKDDGEFGRLYRYLVT